MACASAAARPLAAPAVGAPALTAASSSRCSAFAAGGAGGAGRAELPSANRRRAPARARLNARRAPSAAAVSADPSSAAAPPVASDGLQAKNAFTRRGGSEAALLQAQAAKSDAAQPAIASVLPELPQGGAPADVAVVGCGPAGLALAAALGAQGLSVALVGPEAAFVNVYGVWQDEFESLGLQHCLEHTWPDTACYFDSDTPMRMSRPYGKVGRAELRAELLARCKRAGVRYRPTEVVSAAAAAAGASPAAAGLPHTLECKDGSSVSARLVVMASGAASSKFIQSEETGLEVGAQTAYGLLCEVKAGTMPFDPRLMHFMDFRRHHSGVVPGGARVAANGYEAPALLKWAPSGEVPSFLYAMPLSGTRVFLEETCLAAKPALPFATLKRRLLRRLEALGIEVETMLEEEWSYIPVGGPLPVRGQSLIGYGAAANFVHPATGYSLVRSLKEAPIMAAEIAAALGNPALAAAAGPALAPADGDSAGGPGGAVSPLAARLWDAMWPAERRRQAAFNTFGMELLASLDLRLTNQFFRTFFSLPPYQWRRFLANQLSSVELLLFAMTMFVLAPPEMKFKLVMHLIQHPSGAYMIDEYLGRREGAAAAAAGGADVGDGGAAGAAPLSS